MADYIVRATAADNQIRAFAAVTREMVEETSWNMRRCIPINITVR